MKKYFLVLVLLLKTINTNAQSTGNLHWAHAAYLIITGPTLKKVSNVRTEWNAGAISQENFYSDCWIDFKFPVPKYAVMGLSSFNTSVDPSSIKYGIYAHINGYIYIYENANLLPNVGKGKPIHLLYTANDVFRVERKNGIVYYKKNGAVFYTSTIPSNGSLHIDCAFFQASATITVTDFMGGLVWMGAVSQDWNDPANWSMNRIPTTSDQVIVNACSTCPKLNNTVNIGALQLNNGSNLNLDNHTLIVAGPTFLTESNVTSNEGKIQSADFGEVKNTAFGGLIVLEKTGGVENNCYGGNTFSPELKIINSSNNAWKVSTQADNVVKNF